MTRKVYKVKRRSCPLCKPHKMGHDDRWKPQDRATIRRDEKEVSEAVRGMRDDEDAGIECRMGSHQCG